MEKLKRGNKKAFFSIGKTKKEIADFTTSKHICSRKKVQNNVLLTDKVKIGIDNTRKHKRNLNVIVIGGSGAGKT
ncbi:MAG: hypothetical protein RR415_09940, partial [Ruthenibacterium sp.]